MTPADRPPRSRYMGRDPDKLIDEVAYLDNRLAWLQAAALKAIRTGAITGHAAQALKDAVMYEPVDAAPARPVGVRAAIELTPEEWERIGQVYELVKHEGDERCESAFADLIRIHNALQAALTTDAARRAAVEHALDCACQLIEELQAQQARLVTALETIRAQRCNEMSPCRCLRLAAAALGEEAGR